MLTIELLSRLVSALHFDPLNAALTGLVLLQMSKLIRRVDGHDERITKLEPKNAGTK